VVKNDEIGGQATAILLSVLVAKGSVTKAALQPAVSNNGVFRALDANTKTAILNKVRDAAWLAKGAEAGQFSFDGTTIAKV
jgi:hypothetical protein